MVACGPSAGRFLGFRRPIDTCQCRRPTRAYAWVAPCVQTRARNRADGRGWFVDRPLPFNQAMVDNANMLKAAGWDEASMYVYMLDENDVHAST